LYDEQQKSEAKARASEADALASEADARAIEAKEKKIRSETRQYEANNLQKEGQIKGKIRLLAAQGKVYGKLLGSDDYFTINSTDPKVVLQELKAIYKTKCSVVKNLYEKVTSANGDVVYSIVGASGILMPDTYVEVMPMRHNILFVFRSLDG
jgi:hypothetical protein